jgi:hypothetical protein
VIKIFSKVLCSDVEYKTLSITNQTSSKEVVRLLLNKFRLKHRDPNLFYLTLEVWIRQTGMLCFQIETFRVMAQKRLNRKFLH